LELGQGCHWCFLIFVCRCPIAKKIIQIGHSGFFFIAAIFAIVVMAIQKFKADNQVVVYAICVALPMDPIPFVIVLTITVSLQK
jgi:magnesium-transporting ATPase (P-type)